MNEILLATFLLLISTLSAQAVGSEKEGDIRLIHRNRPHALRGRVEVLHETKWRPVCQDKWTDRETRVLCNQLGFRSRGVTVFGSLYGSGKHPVIPHIYRCRGKEQNLTSCVQKPWRPAKRCGPKQHVSVMCKLGRRDPVTLPMRIVGKTSVSPSGVSSRTGRVEIRQRGLWGSVCAHKFGRKEMKVVCNSVGMPRGRVLKIQKPGRGPIWLSRVKCNGTENSLLHCVRKPWGFSGKCTHKDDVVVRCMGPRIVKSAVYKRNKTASVTHKTNKSATVTQTQTTAPTRIAEDDRARIDKSAPVLHDRLSKAKTHKSETPLHHSGGDRGLIMDTMPDIMVKEDDNKTENTPHLPKTKLEIIPDSVPREPITDLDLAFAIDATGSMSSYIAQAKENIQEITRQISSKAGVNVRLALVEYRDHVPQDMTFVSRQYDFSPSVHDMQRWLDDCSANGGGDAPEAVADAMEMLLTLSWRPDATKVVVLIADAPPHGLELHGDTFANGCPEGHDPIIAAHGLAEMSIVLYTVGCEPSINKYTEFFAGLAYLTGGQYVPLGDAKLLSSVIVGGAEEEISLQQWVPDVDVAVDKLLEAAGGEAGMEDEDRGRMIADVYEILMQRGATVKQLQQNNQTLTPASNGSKEYAAMPDMTSARELFVKKGGGSHGSRRYDTRDYHAGRYDSEMGMPEMAMAGRAGSAGDVHRGLAVPDFAPDHRGRMESESFDYGGSARGSSSKSDTSYSAVEADIDPAQVERLIQRALAKRRKSATEDKSMHA